MSQEVSSDIKKILQVSRHAPSSHNTQPWRVSVKGSSLSIGFDTQRQLSVGDPDKRELLLSLGCFIETVVLQAANEGYATKVSTSKSINPKKIAQLDLTKRKTIKGEFSENLIVTRRSDRRMYEKKHIPAATIAELSKLQEQKATITVLNSPSDIEFLSVQTHESTLKAMSNPAFRAELASWVRNNWTKKTDGMPAYTQGIPGPVSLIAKFVIKKNKAVAKDQAKKDSKRVSNSAAIGIITSGSTVSDYIDAGRLYQRSCLFAMKNKIKTSGVSAAVIDQKTSKQIAKKLKLKDEPVALLRFGYTKNNQKSSPRLHVSDFLES
jgi:nitroreductase